MSGSCRCANHVNSVMTEHCKFSELPPLRGMDSCHKYEVVSNSRNRLIPALSVVATYVWPRGRGKDSRMMLSKHFREFLLKCKELGRATIRELDTKVGFGVRVCYP